jgi:hypothetical protein
MMIWIEIITLGILMLTLLLIVMGSILTGISPMPSTAKAKRQLWTLLPSQIKGTVYELGAGWGTLAFPLAKHFSDHPIVAFERSPVPFLFCFLRHFIQRYPNLSLFYRDFFQTSLQDAGLVVCYLYPEAMRQLKSKFEKELQPGTWIISNTFAIPGWEPHQIISVSDLYHTKIYLYRVPNNLPDEEKNIENISPN